MKRSLACRSPTTRSTPLSTTAAKQAFDDGFLGREMPDLSHLYDLSLLNQVMAEKGRKAIQ